ncbi:hypothetical protein, conserved [Trypanosoma brucei gambiense DAL972]|uniref:Uncharacterized protein n=1 Tax=Trypanosoma brucei gambiense (strain MHOM/CI/86/DAL972) TaxID=679716 RepID=C9ZLY5_TRYB9|nr:hypothetical protein, conserved [Trypanosoma brucei gambiense DAL972]CBH10410.1 hypothetical protein, conserved [Trypanosoma brucei gambiense DAL972]|eukprot:XP_011772700.1 hypothetical protein, conserved [Trypanosoma brucei gambiense DAL972]
MRLSRYVQLNPEVIDSTLQRLSCVSQNITEVDIDMVFLSLLLKEPLPPPVQHAITELLPQGARAAAKGCGRVGVQRAGMNAAIAVSLHTVLLSRNRITTTIGLVQFKSVVRLSLLGNRVQRIEDCEGLSLLPLLQFLSLEFNPVTQLPHYRAHMLRICSWPESLQPKNCRLRKLDTRPVTAVEVERAAQCLQREKVTMGELVQRMRFVAFLIEAKKRIDLHHELRRRGVVVQDITVNMTVENVVTRCSTQLLALVDVSAASHFVRRLMSGRCRLCDINNHDTGVGSDSLCRSDSSLLAQSPNHSQGDINALVLHHPQHAVLTTFCKDWSKDVFRRATTSLDHRICGLLLDIAHALGEELSVVDVDHLNKLWFMQVAKVDNWRLHKQRQHRVGCEDGMSEERSPALSYQSANTPSKGTKGQSSSLQEELVEIMLAPNETFTSGGLVVGDANDEEVSLTCISPILRRAETVMSSCRKKELIKRGSEARDVSPRPLSEKSEGTVNTPTEAQTASQGERDVGLSSSAMPLPQKAPSPRPSPWKEETAVDDEDAFLINRHVKKRVLRCWNSKAKHKYNNMLCSKFVRERLTNLITTTCPTPHSICTTLELLPRTERKRVLFRVWLERARSRYLPRYFQLRSLLMRWRHRAYEMNNITYAENYYRSRTMHSVCNHWCRRLRIRENAARCRLEKSPTTIEEPFGDPVPQQAYAGAHKNCVSEPSTREKGPQQLQPDEVMTAEADGLTSSGKQSLDCAGDGSYTLQTYKTPNVVQRLSLPITTPSVNKFLPTQPPSVSDKTTQTTEMAPGCGTVTRDQCAAARLDARVAVAALTEDRLRLVDRIIALEQRANEEAVTVQHRDREICDLKKRLGLMVLREECLESTLNDYKKKCEHLQAVVQALRNERRELLLPASR